MRIWDFKLHISITTLTFLSLFLSYSLSLGEGTPITLIYSSNTMGEVESGCCPETGNAGGLARRSSYIKTVRKEAKHLFVFDAGDALVIDFFVRKSEREKARKRAEFVLKVYEKIGYDALNIGETDLGLGVEYLRNLQKRSKVPFFSSNLKEKKRKGTIFKPYLIKEVDGLKVGIIGLLTPDLLPYLYKEMNDYFIEDPIKAATETINHSLSHCDHIIALAHLSSLEIESLAEKIPRISIIVGGHERSFSFPKQINQSFWVQTDAFGIHMGRLNLKLVKGSSEFVNALPRTIIRKTSEEIERENKLPDAEDINTYENFLILLHPKMESDPEIEQLISYSRDQLKRPIP